ncbi:hypothetical protein ICN45_07235 [Polynucleobacter sp. UK-Pondora-W15]|nr:hypothetical protein [Polynucleobacter alcilacus]
MFSDSLLSTALTQPYIVYQLEILDDELGHLKNYPKYLEFLSRALSVWDYSPKNFNYLQSKGLQNVEFVPPGYHSISEKLARRNSEHQFDFLFIGSLSPRRAIFLERLVKRGYKVGAVTENNEAFGIKRDQLIAGSKILVNVHCFEDLNTLETVRISYLLTNGAVVISEASDHDPYEGAIGYAKYDELLDYCAHVLSNEESLQKRSADGYAAIRKIDMKNSVEKALINLHLS